MIEFQCPNCGKQLRVKPELAGRTGKCTGCSEKIVVPAAPSDFFSDALDEIALQPIAPVDSHQRNQQSHSYLLAAAEKELADEARKNEPENKSYVDRLIDTAPGSNQLREASGMNIDITKLTVAGWGLAVVVIALATVAAIVPLIMIGNSGSRVSGGVGRAIAIPIVLIVGAGSFWVGRKILGLLGLSIVREG